MPLAHNWLSVLWFALVPPSFTFGALVRYLPIHRASWEHISGVARKRIGLALVATQFVVLPLLWSVQYETALWVALLPVLALVAITLANRAAAPLLPHMMHGLIYIPPRDGMDAVKQSMRPRSVRGREAFLNLVLAILPAIVLYYIALTFLQRTWLGPSLLGILFLVPLAVIPHRRYWLAPLTLLPLVLFFGSHALQLPNELPAGRWSTVISGSDCNTQVRFSVDRGRAWCVDGVRGQVAQFDSWTGLVQNINYLERAYQVFAADRETAWVAQYPYNGLVRYSEDEVALFRFSLVRDGAVDLSGNLWMTFSNRELGKFSPERVASPSAMRAPVVDFVGRPESLLNRTASNLMVLPDGSIWVASIGGASFLLPGAENWQTIGRDDGVSAPVRQVARGPDGALWFLWDSHKSGPDFDRWGISKLDRGSWLHFPIGEQTGLSPPPTPDSLAIDAANRA